MPPNYIIATSTTTAATTTLRYLQLSISFSLSLAFLFRRIPLCIPMCIFPLKLLALQMTLMLELPLKIIACIYETKQEVRELTSLSSYFHLRIYNLL